MTVLQKHSKINVFLTYKRAIYTMSKIHQLSPHEAQKIAAGQVVERPVNVVKELLENALDAGATSISLYIQDGGKKLIQVIDNGYGMDRQDAKRCFEKHATSKIRSVDELTTITSFGFRGEALASIAAVSKVTLLTKEQGATEGTRIDAQEGTISAKPAAPPEGTNISVSDLFYNVPARAKFLKKRETETRHITQMAQAICLGHPKLHFQLFIDDRLFVSCPSQDNILKRCAQLWEKNTARHLIDVNAANNQRGVTICGAISDHQWFRYDRNGIFFLVNNRWVSNYQLGQALLKGYNNVIPHGRYPTSCIAITIDPSLIDINTHPRKQEITFANPRIVQQLIQDTVRSALETNVSKQIKKNISLYQPEMPDIPAAPFEHIPHPISIAETQKLPAEQTPLAPNYAPASKQDNVTPDAGDMPTSPENNYRLVGQFGKTYILIEQQEGLYLIDQHAAHERILYEQFANRFEKIPTIKLMFPQLVTCKQQDLDLIAPHLNIFQQHGIAIEPFGKDQLIIQSTPVHLKDVQLQELIQQVIGWIKDDNQIDQEQFSKSMHNKLQAQMACKAAVKAGDSLTHEQMQELVSDLHACPNRFSCPHGRPTGWLLSLHDIEKMFRRKT